MTQKTRKQYAINTILLIVLILPALLLYRAFHREQTNRDLIKAIRDRDISHVRAALDAGADPNIRGLQDELVSPPVSPLEMLRRLFTGPPAQSSVTGSRLGSRTLPPPMLIMAEDMGQTDVVKLLLERGADPNLPSSSGLTTLMLAASRGQTDVIDALLSRKASRDARTPNGQTALTSAMADNRPEAVRLLLSRGADVNAQNAQGETPLILTVRANEPGTGMDMMGRFVSGASGGPARGSTGALVLQPQDAMPEDYLSRLNLLLACKANVNLADRSGETALMRMAQRWQAPGVYPEDVKLLLEHGANVNLADRSGETALFQAAKNGSIEIVKLLLAHGADARVVDSQGRTTVMVAALASPYAITYFVNGVKRSSRNASPDPILVNRCIALVRLLLRHGVDVNAKDRQGRTALQWITPNQPVSIPGSTPNNQVAILGRRTETIAALKQAGARP